MTEQGFRAAASADLPSDADVTKSIIGVVRAHDLHLTQAGAGFVAANGDLSIVNGGCGPVVANGDVTIRQGGYGPLVAKGDVAITTGGTSAVVAAGGATIGRNAFAGIIVAPQVTVEPGGRVLTTSLLTFGLGAAAGIAVATVTSLARRWRTGFLAARAAARGALAGDR